MINVGFLLVPSKGWLGGVNYFRNLFVAINKVANGRARVLAFVPTQADSALVDEMCRNLAVVSVVRTRLLDRYSLPWLIWRISRRLTGSDFWVGFYLRNFKVAVFSHSSISGSFSAKAVSWIPDFQHLHQPEFFSAEELSTRDNAFHEMAHRSDAVILSSQTAADDFVSFAPEYAKKSAVLRFVSQVPSMYWELAAQDEEVIRHKYGIGASKYVYLPNQFWQHKNHMVVFEAIKRLRDAGLDVVLVCTGSMSDYRNPDYMGRVRQRLHELDIEPSVRLLGIVPYADVYALMRFSACVVNPSRFEGWSSTVEECKSVGKRLVLSDIPVHREQISTALFFAPDEVDALAAHLLQVLSAAEVAPEVERLQEVLDRRTREFGSGYLNIIFSVLGLNEQGTGK